MQTKVATVGIGLIALWVLPAVLVAHERESSGDTLARKALASTGSVTANGLRFSYLEAGEGPLVLLLHGFPDDAHTFDDLLPILANGGYHAVAPFMRGYAPSEIPPDGDYSMLTLGRDALALISAFGEDRATIVGHDWGASAGYAAANLDPSRVRKLVTLAIPHPRSLRPSPRLIWRSRHFIYFQFPWAASRIRRHDLRYVERLYHRWAPAWEVPPAQVRRVKEGLSPPGRLEAALGYYRAAVKDLWKGSRRRVLRGKVSVPTLTLAGAVDGVPLAVYGRTLNHFTSEYHLVLVPGSGHFPHREQPDLVTTELLDFLRR